MDHHNQVMSSNKAMYSDQVMDMAPLNKHIMVDSLVMDFPSYNRSVCKFSFNVNSLKKLQVIALKLGLVEFSKEFVKKKFQDFSSTTTKFH